MAATGTPTTNLGLRIMNGTDPVDVADINANSQTLDDKIGAVPSGTSVQAQITSQNEAITNVQNGLAYIVGNTNTTGSTLTVGQFVYVKGHSTITEGLRTVTASISVNGSITTSNTSACSDGGLNALNSKINKTTFSKFADIPANFTGHIVVTGSGADADSPLPTETSKYFEGFQLVGSDSTTYGRRMQVVAQVYDGKKQRMWVRMLHDATWSAWYEIAQRVFSGQETNAIYTYNAGFLSSGKVYVSITGNCIVNIVVNGISTKTAKDWIGQMASGYKPAKTVKFKYFLGSAEYFGSVETSGLIYFDTLNATDVISANISFCMED